MISIDYRSEKRYNDKSGLCKICCFYRIFTIGAVYNMNEEELEQFNDTVVLMDENGNEQEFEILDAIETDDARYVALMPIYDEPEDAVESSGELLVMRVETEDDGEVLVTIEDDEEFESVLAIFEENLSDYYEIDHLDE